MQQRNLLPDLLRYDGTNFCGWQRQRNGTGVQETLEQRLTRITRTAVQVNGAGRTDAGVHAQGMVANFSTGATMPAAVFAKALNSMLPKDIRILGAEEVAPDFHARFFCQGQDLLLRFLYRPYLVRPVERLYRTHFPVAHFVYRTGFKPSQICCSVPMTLPAWEEAVDNKDSYPDHG